MGLHWFPVYLKDTHGIIKQTKFGHPSIKAVSSQSEWAIGICQNSSEISFDDKNFVLSTYQEFERCTGVETNQSW